MDPNLRSLFGLTSGQKWHKFSVVYQSSVGIAIPKEKQTILLFGFASNTFLSKLDCAWDLKGSHTIVCKTFSHTGDHTILSLSPNYFPPLICFWNRQVTPSIGGKKEKSSLNGQYIEIVVIILPMKIEFQRGFPNAKMEGNRIAPYRLVWL